MRSDEELVQSIVGAPEGDTRAFEELVRRHQASIVANCRYLTRSAEDAEDLAQEVFVKVFFRLDSFEERSRVRTWMQRIKVNHCLNFQKRKKGKRFVDLDDAELSKEESLRVDPMAQPEAIAERALIRDVLDSLPDPLRIPLVLCDVDGLTYQEIADALELGLSAAKMRVARARDLFRRRFVALGGAPPGAASEVAASPGSALPEPSIATGGSPEREMAKASTGRK